MIALEFSRLFSGAIGKTVRSFAGPKLMMALSLAFFMAWGYAKWNGRSADIAALERDKAVSERDQIAALKKQLDVALKQVEQFNDTRTERELANRETIRKVTDDDTESLNLLVPVSILDQLRQSRLSATRADAQRAVVGTSAPVAD